MNSAAVVGCWAAVVAVGLYTQHRCSFLLFRVKVRVAMREEMTFTQGFSFIANGERRKPIPPWP
jgi:hypothetical protein